MISSVSKLYSNLKEAYSKLNPSTLSGAIDAIIVEQADGTYHSSPFHVRFGKLGILQPKEREVDIEVNGRVVDLRMALDDNGTAYFMAPLIQNEGDSSNGLSVSSSSLVNASSTEEIADLLMQDDAEDNEVNQIFSNGANQVLSEPEQSPISSPIGSRAQSPSAKSDSEAPTVKWIEPPAKLHKETKPTGIFLEEITSAREDLLPLYLGSNERNDDDDVESGRGVSIPQSPQPLSTMCRVQEMVPSQVNGNAVPAGISQEIGGEVALSLCGPLISPDGEISLEEFQQYRLSWEAFERDPLRHMSNFDLYVWNFKQDASSTTGKVKCIPWTVYSAQLAAHCAFGRNLADEQVAQMSSRCNAERIATSGSSWFRSLIPRRAKPAAAAATTTVLPAPISDRVLRPNVSADNFSTQDPANLQPTKPPTITPSTSTTQVSAPASTNATPNTPPGEPNRPATVSSRLATDVRYATDDDEDEALYGSKSNGTMVLEVNRLNSAGKERRHPPLRRRGLSVGAIKGAPRRTRRLTTEQVKSLELIPGENLFSFSISHQILGTTRLTCRVFVWRWDDRIIVSDIDGTITRSDVLGQVLPIMGYEWTQPGVTRLFSLLIKNNYKIVYLSARAIGLAQQTRDYLCSIDGLPPGPLLLSPASLVNAFYKEVIERVPERFKINCLREIMKLFPLHECDENADKAVDTPSIPPHTPFYAGFGNRPNDSKAYRAVCIPSSRIFIINPRAEVRMDMGCFKSTYDTLAESVDLFFPAYSQLGTPVGNEFSSFEYWRPRPDI